MKRFAVVLLAAVAAVAPLGIAAAVAANGARVDYALEARDSASDRPLCVLHGKNLHRFVDFSLKTPAGAPVAVPEVLYEARDGLVLALPTDLAPGLYVMDLTTKSGDVLPVPFTARNQGLLPASVDLQALSLTLQSKLATMATKGDLTLLATKQELLEAQVDLSAYAKKEDLSPLAEKALRGARCRTSAGASMAASADFQAVPFDETSFDTDGCRYGSQSRIYCETKGYYMATAKVLLPTGGYQAELRRNGAKVASDGAYTSVVGGSVTMAVAVHLEEDDYLEVFVKATNGSAFAVQPGSELSMVKVGE